MEERLKRVYEAADNDLKSAKTSEAVEQIRVRYLGKKSEFSEVLAAMRDLSGEDRKSVGQIANELRTKLETSIQQKAAGFEEQELEARLMNDPLDPTLPAKSYLRGELHPVHKVSREITRILELVGLRAVYGPEVEYEEFCFDRLNFKPGHPARDMQATFFVKGDSSKGPLVLRTHTSPVQARILMSLKDKPVKLPIRVQVPGRVYRVDDDATHSPMFHQVEGLVVDQRSGMGDLRASLDFFFREFFGPDTKVRFRPSYFPFTEPSAEVDVSCVFCAGKGCKVCKTSGWLEIAGAGLVHPEVFKACGWNPDEVQGWAFGMGVDRLTMLKYKIPDLRLLFENRMSFLRGAR
jgi:phenylalanyl-tRNA synthetase alpha chain